MANTTNPTSSQSRIPQPSQTCLAIQWNLFGLKGRIAELQLLISKFNPIAIALQETLVPENSIPSNFIKGYNLYILENPDNPERTGTAIAIKNDIPHRRVNLPAHTGLLAIAIEIEFPVKVTLISIYISPSSLIQPIKASLSNILDQFTSPVLLMGDFNGHSTVWGSESDDSRGKMLAQLIDDYGLSLLNDGSHTRINPSSGASSALDLSIVSHDLYSQLSWVVYNDCCGSDHLPVVISMNRAPPVLSCRPRWRYELADWANYQNEVVSVFTTNTPSSPEEFIEKIFDIATHHVPRTKGTPGKKSVPWWNPEVRSAVKLRRKKLRALQRIPKEDRPNSAALAEFKAARNAARSVVQQAKQDSWDKFVSSISPETSSKELWDKVHKLSGGKSRQPIKLRIDNRITDDPSEITEHLADHFAKSSSSSNYSDTFLAHKSTIESTP